MDTPVQYQIMQRSLIHQGQMQVPATTIDVPQMGAFKIIKWPYMFLLLLVLVGIIRLEPLVTIDSPVGRIRGSDLLLLFQVFVTIVIFCISPKKRLLTDSMSKLWLFFIFILVCMTINSPSDWTETGGMETFAQLRKLFYFMSYFYILALTSDSSDLNFLFKSLVVIALIGSVLTIMQSLSGPDPLFGAVVGKDHDSYYNIAIWGQFDQIGPLTRVNLPVIFLVVFLFNYYFARMLEKINLFPLFLVGLFSLIIVINFSRGLFAGIFIALVALYFFRGRIINLKYFSIIVGSLLVFSGMFYLFAGDLTDFELMPERAMSGYQEMKYETGNWAGRMEEVELYENAMQRADAKTWLLGFGLYPVKSEVGLEFIHVGWIDFPFRGGILFSLLNIFYLIGFNYWLFRRATHGQDEKIKIMSFSLLAYNITYAIFFFGSNHYWSSYFVNINGVISAYIVMYNNFLKERYKSAYRSLST
jgi:hypothetical protein